MNSHIFCDLFTVLCKARPLEKTQQYLRSLDECAWLRSISVAIHTLYKALIHKHVWLDLHSEMGNIVKPLLADSGAKRIG